MPSSINKNHSVHIVIPYFQRQSGILNRTLKSIDQQLDKSKIHTIIIVDDGSLIPANSELDDLSSSISDRVKIIEQANNGVSRARNVGLDFAIRDNAHYVAFVDSDDVWLEKHLTLMCQAFRLDADFYFANFFQPGQSIGAFERGANLDLEEHTQIDSTLYRYERNMLNQILTGNLIGTSTVGYNIKRFSDLRFKEDLHYAGEDYLFWLAIAEQNPTIIFNNECSVRCEHGVNIFASAKWGTEHLQRRLRDELYFRQTAIRELSLDIQTYQAVNHTIWKTRKTLLKNGLSLLKQGRLVSVARLALIILRQPAILFSALKRV